MCSSSEESEDNEGAALVKPKKEPLELEAPTQKSVAEEGAWLKWASLALLVFQNSGIFMIMRYTRSGAIPGPKYLTTVTVWFSEVAKLLICLAILLIGQLRDGAGVRGLGKQLRDEIWDQRHDTLKLGVPAACYTVQNNLLFLAVTHMSAAASQILYQSKTLSTAFFSVVILGKRYLAIQWFSFALLSVGVILVKQEDSKGAHVDTPGASPLLGATASLAAAGLSGFAGVFCEMMFTKGSTSIWMRNVQLALFTIPLQTLTVWQSDAATIRADGPMVGFHASTWGVVAIQVAGGLIVAVVIKYAGNILKTFAAVLAIVVTCFVSFLVPALGFHATLLFFVGLGTVLLSIYLYAQPCRLPWCDPPA